MSRKTIYNHDIRHCLASGWDGWDLYSGRAAGISRPADIVQLHPELRKLWPLITRHYENIGLNHSRNPVWDVSFRIFEQFPGYEISPFIFTDAVNPESAAARLLFDRDPVRMEIVHEINSKNNFVGRAEKMGIRVPATISFENKKYIPSKSPAFPCFLKPAVSVSGYGIIRCDSGEELNQALQEFPDETPFQIQEAVPACCFLNLQYQVIGKKACPLAATEQLLDGYTHSGSRFPVADPPWEFLDPLADRLAEIGLKGIFAFDLAVAGSPLDPVYFVLECNPRFNGSTYPVLIAKELGIEAWSCEAFSTKYRHLNEVDLSGIEYDAETGRGVILINWGTILAGYLGILLAGSPVQQNLLRAELLKRL